MRNRRFPDMGDWATWYALLVGIWAMLALDVFGIWRAPDWLFWSSVAIVTATGLLLIANPRPPRRPSWRVTDSRTTEGDERGTSWAKDD